MSTNGERTEGTKAPATTGTDPRGTGAVSRGGAASGRSSASPAASTTGRGVTDPTKEAWEILHDCERGLRYHAARSVFFDRCHKWMMAAVVASGGIALLFASPEGLLFSKIVMSIPIVVGAIEASWSLARQTHVHSDLERRYREIKNSIDWKRASEEAVEEWKARIEQVDNSAPKSVYHALNAVSYNAATQAVGLGEDYFQRISWWRRLLRNWVRFSANDFPLKS